MSESQSPLLSVVVAIVSDTTDSRSDASHLDSCLQALSQQIDAPPMEIIVPYHGNVSGIESMKAHILTSSSSPLTILKPILPKVEVANITMSFAPRGLAVARGEIIGLLEDHGRSDPHWCARMVEAHQQTSRRRRWCHRKRD